MPAANRLLHAPAFAFKRDTTRPTTKTAQPSTNSTSNPSLSNYASLLKTAPKPHLQAPRSNEQRNINAHHHRRTTFAALVRQIVARPLHTGPVSLHLSISLISILPSSPLPSLPFTDSYGKMPPTLRRRAARCETMSSSKSMSLTLDGRRGGLPRGLGSLPVQRSAT